MKLIRQKWENYRLIVVPQGAPQEQVRQLRCAFYAGAESLLCATLAGFSEGSEAEPADLALMAGIEAEFREFAEDLKAGRVV